MHGYAGWRGKCGYGGWVRRVRKVARHETHELDILYVDFAKSAHVKELFVRLMHEMLLS